MTGAVHSIMFYPTAGRLDYSQVGATASCACITASNGQGPGGHVSCPDGSLQLKVGNTVFIRYATRCFFSDLATEAIKVEDLKLVRGPGGRAGEPRGPGRAPARNAPR